MGDQRSDDLKPTTATGIGPDGLPIDPDQIDAPQSAPMDDAAGGPSVTPPEEEVAAKLGDFA